MAGGAAVKIKRLPLPDGSEVPAREVDFQVVREEWSEYKLADGGTVRLRATALKIYRVLDAQGKPAFTPQGDPNLVVTQQAQIVVSD